MRVRNASLISVLVLAAFPALAADAVGYGPWRLGMTREQVSAEAAQGPYTPVASTGGLETRNATFRGRKITASFVFDAGDLFQIQLWAYEGEDPAQAFAALHRAYGFLADQFGEIETDQGPLPAGLSEAALTERIPAAFKSGAAQSVVGKLPPQGGSMQVQVVKFHLRPARCPAGAEVYASLLHSPQLGVYYVFVYYKTPAAG